MVWEAAGAPDLAALPVLARLALAEDIGAGDVTTVATVPEDLPGRGTLLAKQDLVLAGLAVARAVFEALDPQVELADAALEGQRLRAGEAIGTVRGQARALLSAERVALNFLQRLSGVATLTAAYVQAVRGTRAVIRDTRKTTPLLRGLQKQAVVLGGGMAHRAGLDRGILVKDNHIRLAGSVGAATRRASAAAGGRTVEVEVESQDQIEEALAGGAQVLLLDNFDPAGVRRAVEQISGRVPVEVSGGVSLETVRAFAEAGADFIAIGALTHSAPAVDISLEIGVV